jgi:hypothetical protein
MYDRFVFQSITILQGIESKLNDTERLGASPSANPSEGLDSFIDRELRHYAAYRRSILALSEAYGPLLQKLRKKHQVDYKYDLRLLDKLLWMLGNPSIKVNQQHDAVAST